jgi:hypothetical protein
MTTRDKVLERLGVEPHCAEDLAGALDKSVVTIRRTLRVLEAERHVQALGRTADGRIWWVRPDVWTAFPDGRPIADVVPEAGPGWTQLHLPMAGAPEGT